MGVLTYGNSMIRQCLAILVNLPSARPPFLLFHKESEISSGDFLELTKESMINNASSVFSKITSGEWVLIPLNMNGVVVFDEFGAEFNSSVSYAKTTEELNGIEGEEPDVKEIDTIETSDELKISFKTKGELLGILNILSFTMSHDFHKFKEDYKATFLDRNFQIYGGLTMKNINISPSSEASGGVPDNAFSVAIVFDRGYSRRKGETIKSSGSKKKD